MNKIPLIIVIPTGIPGNHSRKINNADILIMEDKLCLLGSLEVIENLTQFTFFAPVRIWQIPTFVSGLKNAHSEMVLGISI